MAQRKLNNKKDAINFIIKCTFYLFQDLYSNFQIKKHTKITLILEDERKCKIILKWVTCMHAY